MSKPHLVILRRSSATSDMWTNLSKICKRKLSNYNQASQRVCVRTNSRGGKRTKPRCHSFKSVFVLNRNYICICFIISHINRSLISIFLLHSDSIGVTGPSAVTLTDKHVNWIHVLNVLYLKHCFLNKYLCKIRWSQ